MNATHDYQLIQQLQARVAKLERTVAFLLSKLEIEYVDDPPNNVDPEIFKLVQAGKTIEAIKLYREKTGADLRTAKDFIESMGI